MPITDDNLGERRRPRARFDGIARLALVASLVAGLGARAEADAPGVDYCSAVRALILASPGGFVEQRGAAEDEKTWASKLPVPGFPTCVISAETDPPHFGCDGPQLRTAEALDEAYHAAVATTRACLGSEWLVDEHVSEDGGLEAWFARDTGHTTVSLGQFRADPPSVGGQLTLGVDESEDAD